MFTHLDNYIKEGRQSAFLYFCLSFSVVFVSELDKLAILGVVKQRHQIQQLEQLARQAQHQSSEMAEKQVRCQSGVVVCNLAF